ncbi:hypothetical protein BKI49_25615 [Streptomyces sp. Tue6028]|uniref:hypothetical protein n=1 Tax=Streptomyces sp. Tue6028 TaxID=2036037 RepID=UPI000BB32AB7|nr:hypothetical protein [Streptomyces sp. Tue6028]PBC61367.1 hypothetical protein BKI49_25615 [Streptomyces sp. Tue6028]
MPADEVTHGTEVDESRVRTGPRHAAPRKPLFTRFHMPAGKAIALAAMPTAVLMGMGLTPTLAQAEDHPTAKSLTADEYQKCVEAVTGSEDGKDASDTASPSASPSASESADKATPKPSSSSDSSDKTSSSDSGSDDKAEPTPSASSSSASTSQNSSDGAASTPAPSASESSKNPLDPLGVGDALKDLLTPDDTASPTPTPSASASASKDSSASDDKSVSDTVKDTTDKVTKTVEDTVKDTTDTASKAASDATEKVQEAADAATASPSPSASESTDASDCPVATDDEGGVDNPVALPDDPWYLNASSLLLKGADYKGIVKVKTANGSTKRVLKYVISDGTDIGDLHQTVNDKQSGKTYHVQAAKGSTSTIRDGKTIMYTESISGNLLGLIPITFDPDNPPPLNIPLIYFTKVKVVQAGQFGGTLTVPGLHQYTTD